MPVSNSSPSRAASTALATPACWRSSTGSSRRPNSASKRARPAGASQADAGAAPGRPALVVKSAAPNPTRDVPAAVSAGKVAETVKATLRAALRSVEELGLREMTGRERFRAWGSLKQVSVRASSVGYPMCHSSCVTFRCSGSDLYSVEDGNNGCPLKPGPSAWRKPRPANGETTVLFE